MSSRRLHRDLDVLGSTPAVFVNRPVRGRPSVLLRSAPAVAQAVRHPASLGHRSAVYLGGPPASWAASERGDAVRRTSRAAGLSVRAVPVGAPTFEAAAEAVDAIVDPPASAVFAFNGQMALGVIAGLTQRGIAVPGDISVIGGDDVPMAAVTAPPLTTVSLPTEEAGGEAVRMLREGGPTVDLASSFIVRGSTGPATDAPANSSSRCGHSGTVRQ